MKTEIKKHNEAIFKNPNEKTALMSLCLIFMVGFFTKFLFHSILPNGIFNDIIQTALTFCLVLIHIFQVIIIITVLCRLFNRKIKNRKND